MLGMQQQHDMVHVSSAGSFSPSASSAKALCTSTLRLRSFFPLLLAFLAWPASCTCATHLLMSRLTGAFPAQRYTCSRLLTALCMSSDNGPDGLQSVPVGLLLSQHALASRSLIRRSSRPPRSLSGPGSLPSATLQTSACPVNTRPHPKCRTVSWQSLSEAGSSLMSHTCSLKTIQCLCWVVDCTFTHARKG